MGSMGDISASSARAEGEQAGGIPIRRAGQRTVALAGIPLGFACRAAVGWGRRLVGGDREQISADLARRGAEELFAVLSQLKGGAMKVGQALSVFEAAVPAEFARPYRDALSRLQSAAEPIPAAQVHRVLAEQFGRGWRGRFRDFDDTAAAAASIGQVHRGIWADGRDVAVKVQYPGAEEALLADLGQLQRFGRLLQPLLPGLAAKPLLAELRAQMAHELDYRAEADHQRVFAATYDGDDTILVPRVVASAPRAIVSEWVDGTPLAAIISRGDTAGRDRAGQALVELHNSAPQRARLLHADPHPGNFRLLSDGRLGVLDFGAVARLPDGMPRPLSRLTRLALDGRAEELLALLHSEDLVRPGVSLPAIDALEFFAPLAEPMATAEFHFTRGWLRSRAGRVTDPHQAEFRTGRGLNLPEQYMLIHRVTLGSIGMLCQLGATVRVREVVQRWQPGFTEAA
jgi:predicted unusual protein kinase regulating ubiquinone biosynthesis (AarF/ABC1/UbiB family)